MAEENYATKRMLEDLDTKIKNNRERAHRLNEKIDENIKELSGQAKFAPKNRKKIKDLASEADKLKKQEKKDRRRIIKLENKMKNNRDDLNEVKSMQLKDYQQLKSKVNEQTDFLKSEAMKLNKLVDSLDSSALTESGVSKTTLPKQTSEESDSPNYSSSNTSGLSEEEIAVRLVSLYFQEVARVGFKKSLTLSEVVNAYQHVLDKIGKPMRPKPAKRTVTKTEKTEEEAENLMEDLKELKKSIQPEESAAPEKLPERKIEGFSYTNKKGQTYYLHKKGRLYYFSKDPMHAVEKPQNLKVVENKQTGLPLVKKKK